MHLPGDTVEEREERERALERLRHEREVRRQLSRSPLYAEFLDAYAIEDAFLGHVPADVKTLMIRPAGAAGDGGAAGGGSAAAAPRAAGGEDDVGGMTDLTAPITVLCGAPGGGIHRLASFLIRASPSRTAWHVADGSCAPDAAAASDAAAAVVLATPESCIAAAKRAVAEIKAARLAEAPGAEEPCDHRVLVLAPGYADPIDIVRALLREPSVRSRAHIAAVVAVVTTAGFFRRARRHQPAPRALEQCAAGWTNGIVIMPPIAPTTMTKTKTETKTTTTKTTAATAATKTKTKTTEGGGATGTDQQQGQPESRVAQHDEDVEAWVRTANPRAPVIAATVAGAIPSAGLDTVLSRDAFADPKNRAIRHVTTPLWSAPDFSSGDPAVEMQSTWIPFPARAVSRDRVRAAVASLFDRSAIRAADATTPGVVCLVRGTVRVAPKAGDSGDDDGGEVAAASSSDAATIVLCVHATDAESISITTAAAPSSSSSSSSSSSTTPATSTVDQLLQRAASLPLGFQIVHESLGESDTDGSGTEAAAAAAAAARHSSLAAKLTAKLTAARPAPPQLQPLLDAATLDPARLEALHTAHLSDPLPQGVFFNGRKFVDFDGNKSDRHPGFAKVLEEYIASENERIARENSAAEEAIRAWEAEMNV
jgi:hypothetical protein